jgi:hypothetical protein
MVQRKCLGSERVGLWRGSNWFGPAPLALRLNQGELRGIGCGRLVAAFAKNEPYCTDQAAPAVEFLDVSRYPSFHAVYPRSLFRSLFYAVFFAQPIHAARSSKVPPGNRRMIWQGGSKMRISRLLLLTLLMLAIPAGLFAQFGVSITIAPPALPVYTQPMIPADGYLWTPGYWANGADGYFWVPGTWVMPPEAGLLWTPGYWGWENDAYAWNGGYWGTQIGFYGGVNYGFGYGGVGYGGGYWNNGAFYYNRSVNNVSVINIHNVYSKTVINNTAANHVSYNGGTGGIRARPTAAEETATHERHTPATAMQTEHIRSASTNHALLASVNKGRPAIAATSKPGEFSGKGVMAARQAGAPYKTTASKPAENKAATRTNESKAAENKASATRTSETRAAENKPPESKATTTRTDESKAAERKAAENKAVASRTSETRAAENKSAESKAATTRTNESKAAENKAAATRTNENKATENKEATTRTNEDKAAANKAAKPKPEGPTRESSKPTAAHEQPASHPSSHPATTAHAQPVPHQQAASRPAAEPRAQPAPRPATTARAQPAPAKEAPKAEEHPRQ